MQQVEDQNNSQTNISANRGSKLNLSQGFKSGGIVDRFPDPRAVAQTDSSRNLRFCENMVYDPKSSKTMAGLNESRDLNTSNGRINLASIMENRRSAGNITSKKKVTRENQNLNKTENIEDQERKSIRLVRVDMEEAEEQPQKKIITKKHIVPKMTSTTESNERPLRKSFKAKPGELLEKPKLQQNVFFASLAKLREKRSKNDSPTSESRTDRFEISIPLNTSQVANSDRLNSRSPSPSSPGVTSSKGFDRLGRADFKPPLQSDQSPTLASKDKPRGPYLSNKVQSSLQLSSPALDQRIAAGGMKQTKILKPKPRLADTDISSDIQDAITPKGAHSNVDISLNDGRKRRLDKILPPASPVSSLTKALASPAMRKSDRLTLQDIFGGSKNQSSTQNLSPQKRSVKVILPPKSEKKLNQSFQVSAELRKMASSGLDVIAESKDEQKLTNVDLSGKGSEAKQTEEKQPPSTQPNTELQDMNFIHYTPVQDRVGTPAETPQVNEFTPMNSSPQVSNPTPISSKYTPKITTFSKQISRRGTINMDCAKEQLAALAMAEKYGSRGREKVKEDGHNNSAFIPIDDQEDSNVMKLELENCELNRSMDHFDKLIDVPTTIGNNSNGNEFADQDTKDSVEQKQSNSQILEELSRPKSPKPEKTEAVAFVERIFKANPAAKFLSMKIKEFFETREGKIDINYKTTISNYDLVKCIGKGTFGKVHLGLQVLTNEQVAVKAISKKYLALDENGKKKVESEIYLLMKSFRFKSVINLLEVVESRDYYFLIMEFASQGDLVSVIKKRGPIPEEEAKGIFLDVLSALDSLHKHNIVHRDVKLDNILLTEEGFAKLADLGISKQLKPGEKLTQVSATPVCQAPETINTKEYDGFGADIWSLGIMLYNLVYGKVPFKADTIEQVYEKITKADISFPSKPPTSPQLRNLLLRMLQKDYNRRINIEEIKSHVWIEDFVDPRQKPAPETWNGIKREALANNIVRQLGFPKSYLLDSLRQNSFNHATACYYVLLDSLSKKK